MQDGYVEIGWLQEPADQLVQVIQLTSQLSACVLHFCHQQMILWSFHVNKLLVKPISLKNESFKSKFKTYKWMKTDLWRVHYVFLICQLPCFVAYVLRRYIPFSFIYLGKYVTSVCCHYNCLVSLEMSFELLLIDNIWVL